jgi:hypothetical protein
MDRFNSNFTSTCIIIGTRTFTNLLLLNLEINAL